MSIFKVQLLIFVLFCFFLNTRGLEILALEKKYLILQTKSTIKNITDELFKKLNFKSVKFDAKLKHILIVHNYHEDDKTLNEIVSLSKTDKSIIKSETENLMALLNEILNEDIKSGEHESAGSTSNNDKDTQKIDQYLVNLYEIKESTPNLNYIYDNLDIKNELMNILTLDYTSTLNASQNRAKQAEISENLNDEYWRPKTRRLFQGERTFIKYFPFMASIRILNVFQCGGSIVKSDLVITAGSCLQLAWNNRSYSENPALLTVRVGSNFYNGGGKVIPVREVYFHPKYNPKNLRNNIALLRLKEQLVFKDNKKLKRIDIDRSASPLPAVTDGITVVGWGARDANYPQLNTWSDQVNYAVLDVYTLKECLEVYSSAYVTKKNFCAGFTSKGGGACNHDVGGPGIVSGVLAGVMSFGSPVCGTPDAPTVFEKVGYHADWIETIMKLDISGVRKTQKNTYMQFSPVEYTKKDSNVIATSYKTPDFLYPSMDAKSQLIYNQEQSLRSGREDHYDFVRDEELNQYFPSSTIMFIDQEDDDIIVNSEEQTMKAKWKHFSANKSKSIKPVVKSTTNEIGIVGSTSQKTTTEKKTKESRFEIKSKKYTVAENNLSQRDENKALESMIVKLIDDMNITKYTNESQGHEMKAETQFLASSSKDKERSKKEDVMTLLYISDEEKNSITFDDINEIFKDLDGNLGGGEIISPNSFNDMTFRSAVMDIIAETKLKDLLSGDDGN